MAFQRLSLRGFDSELTVRRQIVIYNGRYLVWATLYEGHHWRRKIDTLSTTAELSQGRGYADALVWALQNQLIEKHGLVRDRPLPQAG